MMHAITQVLNAIEHGDPHAAERLLPLVYDELRKLAAERMAQEKPGQTLQATALVHEAYLRLVGDQAAGAKSQEPLHWDSRRHFFAAAAEAMRRILIDGARRKRTEKHGGGRRRVNLDDVEIAAADRAPDLLALDDALTKLAAEDPVKAQLVNLRYFAGLSVQEAADALGISRATAGRYWSYARTFLFCELGGSPRAEESQKKLADP
jgi:RNA polymerase sigma factor (TIGR02999 family)